MSSSNTLLGKTVVITGASSGVGLATALAFAEEGCCLVLAARGEEALNKAVSKCEALGADAVANPTDVSDAEAVQRLTQKTLERYGRIDIWINNAGVMATGKLEDMPFDTLDQIVKTNLLGYVHGARSVLPVFRLQNHGVLINNISIGGWMPAPYGTVYTASKFGIRGMVETLQGEVSDAPDIHVCALYPSIQRSTGNMHSAKYSGLDFKIPPLASDPKTLAAAMVRIAKHPRKSAYINWAALIFKWLYGFFPRLMVNTNSAAIRLMMHEDSDSNTDGNVLHPSQEPMQVYGETMLPVPSRTTTALLLGGLGVAVAFLLLNSKRDALRQAQGDKIWQG